MQSVFVALTSKVSKRDSKRTSEVVWRRLSTTPRAIGALNAGGEFVEDIETMVACDTASGKSSFGGGDVFKGQLLPRLRSEPSCLGGLGNERKIKKEENGGFVFLNGMLLVPAAQVTHDSPVRVAVKSTIGKRDQMEDANCVAMNLARIPLSLANMGAVVPDFLKLLYTNGVSEGMNKLTLRNERKRLQSLYGENIQCVYDDIHMFTVCDGHGGASVSQYCTANIRRNLVKALDSHLQACFSHLFRHYETQKENSCRGNLLERSLAPVAGRSSFDNNYELPLNYQRQLDHNNTLKKEVGAYYVDSGHPSNCKINTNNISTALPQSPCKVGLTAELLADAMTQSFEWVDQEVRQAQIGELQGSTMVMALVGTWVIGVANCGDSRAVLSRGGDSIRLSRDHKPELEDEKARVSDDGGFILDVHGCPRVNGVLAMTRAIGDHSFTGITATPECTVLHRTQDDEFLIMASDGLWDVIDDEEACNVTKRCLARADIKNVSSVAATVAARVLLQAAVSRGSSDNTTVMVIDLRGGRVADSRVSKRTKVGSR